MERYLNLAGNSGIAAYEIFPRGILIEFLDGALYRYDEETCGREIVDRLKTLAEAGEGLNRFINQSARDCYSARLR